MSFLPDSSPEKQHSEPSARPLSQPLAPVPENVERPETLVPHSRPLDLYKPNDDANIFTKPMFFPPKPVPHSPKISPSSIPNPSPSVTTNKPLDTGYPSYGSYPYSIPGYSAFQQYSSMPPPPPPVIPPEAPATEFTPFPSITSESSEEKNESDKNATDSQPPPALTPQDLAKPQTDFEEKFTPEVIPAITTSVQECKSITQCNESKMSITSLAQGSGATVTIPSQIPNVDIKKKTPERFSLKTSIPISKIDMKCVNTPETIVTNALAKKPFNPAFQNIKSDLPPKVEIQSNIIIKTATKESEKVDPKQVATTAINLSPPPTNNTLINTPNTLINTPNTIISAPNTTINATNTIVKSPEVIKPDTVFRKPEPKVEVINEVKDPPPIFVPPSTTSRAVFNPINLESSKVNFPPKPTEGNFNEQKNQILFIQNKNQNPKMLLTIQQQNPQVLLQRANFESKNVQVPSRLSNQSKKCKEDVIENGTSSKVVALKRMHQENCDENDFENLITENQIYGNKIVVKEKSQGTLQEQDLKNKKSEKPVAETKNVVLQPNFVYLSNVQFPANLMMIKNNVKVNTNTDPKINKLAPNENKGTNEASTMTNSNDFKSIKPQNVSVSKEIHVLKSSNSVLQTISNKTNKTDVVFHPPQSKVIMNSQILYQMPMIVEADNKINQQNANREFTKFVTPKKEFQKSFEHKSNDKVFIACPYQVDSNSKLQPKIVFTNIRPKISKIDEVSSLDIYEKRKRLRRLKYLTNRDAKESTKIETKRFCEKVEGIKSETKKVCEKVEVYKNIITPDTMEEEICKEFTNTKADVEEESSDSDSDYDNDKELIEYNSIINQFKEVKKQEEKEKTEFLAFFRLGTHEFCKDRELDRRERIIKRDRIASAYIAAGRLDKLLNQESAAHPPCKTEREREKERIEQKEAENEVALQKKQMFLSELRLAQVTQEFKEDYERTWQEVLKERKRRIGTGSPQQVMKQPKITANPRLELDHNSQLLILTEIKKSVNENNNLIKKRLDCSDNEANDGDSIPALAEKNISELNRLSKMADRSVKLITAQNTRKRDLNPGFDSENIQRPLPKVEKPFRNYPFINIPNISKIISLKTHDTEESVAVTTQATSMDEPVNSAAGVEVGEDRTKEIGCQVEDHLSWPGIELLVKYCQAYEIARKKEVLELHRRNTALRVQGAHITRTASRDSDQAKAILAERQHLLNEEADVRKSIQIINAAVEIIKNYY